MLTRVLVALLLAPPFLWCLHAGGWPLALMLGLLSVVALREMHRLNEAAAPDPVEQLLAGVLGASGLGGSDAVVAALALAVARVALPLGFPPVQRLRVHRTMASLAGLVLYVLPFALVQCLRQGPEGLPIVGALVALVWAQDSGAYFTGMALGSHKLSPEISPKKTWEGTIGGFLLGLIAAQWAFQALGGSWTQAGLPHEFAGGALLGAAAAAAQLGDLVESGLKRATGVKDSGDLMPGHGGVLDRFDGFALASLMFAAVLLGARAAGRAGVW